MIQLALGIDPEPLSMAPFTIAARKLPEAQARDFGLAVHERPFLSPSDQTPLQAGMVITNEPGIYRPGWGGVRLEEMVLVTDKGPEVLTPASREVSLG